MKFRDISFPSTFKYGSDLENIPLEFYEQAFPIAKNIDLLLGYFSSNAFKVLSYSLAEFIHNNGKMRIVTNHVYSQKDKEALFLNQNSINEDVIIPIFNDVERLASVLCDYGLHFFDCLKYLLKKKQLEILPVRFNKTELSHSKRMILFDGEDYISTEGSINFTLSALVKNAESLEINAPWNGDIFEERVKSEKNNFNRIFNHTHPDYDYLDVNHIEGVINTIGRDKEIKDLLDDSFSLTSNTFGNKVKRIVDAKKERFENYVSSIKDTPKFPFEKPKPYQDDAYNAWIQNSYQGIFAMATGSGKTITSLNCVLNLYNKYGYYKVIVVVPTQALALQWEKEVERFNFQNVVSTHTHNNWKYILSRYTTRSLLLSDKNIVIITTYATFNKENIQSFISKTKGMDSFIYIADEVHNVGSPSSLRKLPEKIKWRIGLSATPERIYDEIGSKKLYNFFNSKPPEYTFRYTMKQAIDENILCHYDYFPIFVELTEVEMAEYEKITKELRNYIDSKTGKYKPEAEMLLIKRKRIVHQAKNKKVAITKLLDSFQSTKMLDYTFVFVPEGYEPDYSNCDSFSVDSEDAHIIDEYSDLFSAKKYSYYKYMGGIKDAENVLKSFAQGDIQVLLSMKCLDEGVDIPRAEHAIFCASTGNPRQFVQRRGRVLRRSEEKEKAKIWDLIVTPPDISEDSNSADRNLFISEVKRIVNFAALADNQIEILYGELKEICDLLLIDIFEMLEKEQQQYN